MKLTEQVSRIKGVMGVISEQKEPNTYYFTKKKSTDMYTTFENIDLPFNPAPNTKITLVNKNNPEDTYEFTFGKDLMKSKFRDNEAYSKVIKPKFNFNPFEDSQFIRDCVKAAFPSGQYEWQEDNEEFSRS